MSLALRLMLGGGLALLLAVSAALAATLLLGRPLPWQFQFPAVSLHIGAALGGLILGAAQLVLPKGNRRHRLIGYLWCALLALVAVSGLAVRLDGGDGATVIHRISSWFSVATLTLLPIVVHAGRTGRRRAHRNALLGIVALMFIAGALTLLPQRAIGALFVGLLG